MQKCPHCGSRMRLRIARRGPNKGGQFWGCTRYPACKGTLEYKPTDIEADESEASDSLHPGSAFPRPAFPCDVTSRPLDEDGHCVFFQACALPAPLVTHLHKIDADRGLVRALSQWRLDFPSQSRGAVAAGSLALIAVAESLLTRGTTPFCSQSVEKVLREDAAAKEALEQVERAARGRAKRQMDADPVVQALQRVLFAPTCRFHPIHPDALFDSAEEQAVFEWIRTRVEKGALGWSLVPQIALASIAPAIDPATRQRGNLLLVHPARAAILVEVGGTQHEAHAERDEARDRALQEAGVRVVRISTAEAKDQRGDAFVQLEQLLNEGQRDLPPETVLSGVIRWCKYVHQIQLAVVTALRFAWLRLDTAWHIGIILSPLLRDDPQASEITRVAVADLHEVLLRLGRLYGTPPCEAEPRVSVISGTQVPPDLNILIGPAGESTKQFPPGPWGRFVVSDVFLPVEIKASCIESVPARLESPQREDARWFLRYLFRKDDFREGQWETIERTLRGLDSIVLLPTGAGKSIAFQLAALLLPGRCIVVDPIVSLIEDQIDNLAAAGIDRCIGITSELTSEERQHALRAFQSGHYLFCYVAPERFQTEPFRQALRALTASTPVSLIAIDEAHCVSEWGHDFRTAYLNLGRITREYCASRGVVPPLVALTGTASKIVLKDVQRVLGITAFDAIITPKSFDRSELHFTILTSRSAEKEQRVLGFLETLPTRFRITKGRLFSSEASEAHAGLVFCPHVNGPFGTSSWANHLSEKLSIPVGTYSGQPPRFEDQQSWNATKRETARAFKRDETLLLACTKAFGMGIDKPNIRFTIHISLPSSIESFYQEAGRAGRDGHRAECAIVLSNDHPKRSEYVLSPATPLEEVKRIVEQAGRHDADDVIRALWFHVRAFRGEQQETADIEAVLRLLGDVRMKRQVTLTWLNLGLSPGGGLPEELSRERAEKALHRLVVIGVVEDYTLDFGSQEFAIRIAGATAEEIAEAYGRYVGTYNQRLGEQAKREALSKQSDDHNAYILEVARLLIRFLYQHIELARRRALNEMLQAALSATSGEELRRRLVNYLAQSEWDERLEALRSSPLTGVENSPSILDELVSPNDAVALRAATARALGSYPDFPGLLILRSLSEVLCPDADPVVVSQNLEAALNFAFENFQLPVTDTAAAVGNAVSRAANKENAAELMLESIPAWSRTDRLFVRTLIRHLPPQLAGIPARWLMEQLASRCAALIATEGG